MMGVYVRVRMRGRDAEASWVCFSLLWRFGEWDYVYDGYFGCAGKVVLLSGLTKGSEIYLAGGCKMRVVGGL